MTTTVTVYDRAIVITDRREMVDFLSDPRAFLEKAGALDGLATFNGAKAADGTEHKSNVEIDSFLEGKDRVISVHIGTPYKDACKWIYY